MHQINKLKKSTAYIFYIGKNWNNCTNGMDRIKRNPNIWLSQLAQILRCVQKSNVHIERHLNRFLFNNNNNNNIHIPTKSRLSNTVSEQILNCTSAQLGRIYSAIHVDSRWKIQDIRQIVM